MKLPPPPRISGRALRALVRATDADPVRRVVAALMRRDLKIDELRALPARVRGPMPLTARPLQARLPPKRASEDLPLPDVDRAHAPTAARFTALYRSGALDPVEVARRCFEASRSLASRAPAMDPLLYRDEARALRDAEASAKRWRAGQPLGPLDGVPVPVKEEVDLEGHGARLGTARPARTDVVDATAVARLRAAGAIVIGQTVMTEYGMTPLGVSATRVLPRNPHDTRCSAGGSSTGSAVAVTVGLAPVALGSDGGGSIRTPASFNGIWGIKPTFGRISRRGDGFGGTVAHVGPLGASVLDLAHFLQATSGEDPDDVLTDGNPGFVPGFLEGAMKRGVRGLRIGVIDGEMEDAHPEVAKGCRDALSALEREGAVIVPVRLPLARWAPAMGYLTIGLETHAAMIEERRTSWSELGTDLQLLLRVMSTFASDDYLDAQQLRAGLRRDTAALLREVDVLALPTAGRTAPAVSDSDVLEGMADTVELDAACRYAFLGNLTGLPAASAPIGRDARGMPIGLQILGDAWDEATVLQVCAHLERTGIASVPRPEVRVDVLRAKA
ncbi:amidase [Sandaracinus amylolyticus]|uniref:Glutamyl-tRNA(Gln) amidotransferase subunit A-like protein n=1 Tax=Sandaracinus amylolyticus TaxID=927083 RepID=A0A0F6W134_9BACT|nr:amidase [Sandaracinus amylolyticus]AKF04736.1 Glutamyl-tRNA(Gln) amidotransferase subunit A-like protein [Sandaracinus amylolyticus]